MEKLRQGVERRLMIVRGTLAFPTHMRALGNLVFQHLYQPGLPNPRLPTEHDHLIQAILGLGPALTEQGEFSLPADKGGEPARRGHREAGVVSTGPQDAVEPL